MNAPRHRVLAEAVTHVSRPFATLYNLEGPTSRADELELGPLGVYGLLRPGVLEHGLVGPVLIRVQDDLEHVAAVVVVPPVLVPPAVGALAEEVAGVEVALVRDEQVADVPRLHRVLGLHKNVVEARATTRVAV